MPPRHRNALAAIFLLLGALCGCAAPNANLSPDAQVTQQINFFAGGAILSCGHLACADSYGRHRLSTRSLYKTGDWHALETEVMDQNYDIDQAWFYLGASAEGMGADLAAQRYYFSALTSRFKCHYGLLNVCDGLNLPELTEQRLMALNAKLMVSAEFEQLSSPPSASGQPIEIQMLPGQGAVFRVPGLLDGKIPLLFAVSSGSTGVTIPNGLAVLMSDQGLLKKSDVVGETNAILSNGAITRITIIHIASLQIGGVVLHDLDVGYTPGAGEPQLGQSFLNRFKSWSIDNSRQLLILQPN